MAQTPPGYTVIRIYVIICDRCNEDITRPLGGEDITTRDEVDRYIATHERVFHPRQETES